MEQRALDALRLGRLLDVLGTRVEPAAPLRVLDAGCGTGWLTRALASFGHQVDGIDSDEAAVAACRGQGRADGRDRYAVSTLEAWAPANLYDTVIYSTFAAASLEPGDDSLWEASVVNLASLVRLGGRLVLADHDSAKRRYVDLLGGQGLAYRRFVPFEPRDPGAGLHVLDRIT